VCAEAEVGARGATAVALGLSPDPGGETVDPDPGDVDRLSALQPAYDALRDLAVRASRVPLP
jgi:gluconokinase